MLAGVMMDLDPETSVLYPGFVAGSCFHTKDKQLDHLHSENGTRGPLLSRTRAPPWQSVTVLETHSRYPASFCPSCGRHS